MLIDASQPSVSEVGSFSFSILVCGREVGKKIQI